MAVVTWGALKCTTVPQYLQRVISQSIHREYTITNNIKFRWGSYLFGSLLMDYGKGSTPKLKHYKRWRYQT